MPEPQRVSESADAGLEPLFRRLRGAHVLLAGTAVRHTSGVLAAGGMPTDDLSSADVALVDLADTHTSPAGYHVPVMIVTDDPDRLVGAVLPESFVTQPDPGELAQLRHDLLTGRDHAIGADAAVRHLRDLLSKAESKIADLNEFIGEIYASRTWRVGTRIVAPAFKLKRIVER